MATSGFLAFSVWTGPGRSFLGAPRCDARHTAGQQCLRPPQHDGPHGFAPLGVLRPPVPQPPLTPMTERKGPQRKGGTRVVVDPPVPVHGRRDLVVAIQLNASDETVGRWVVPMDGEAESYEPLGETSVVGWFL